MSAVGSVRFSVERPAIVTCVSNVSPGQGAQARGQILEEHARGFARVAIARQRQTGREHAVAVEPAIDALDIQKALHQEGGAEEQCNRDRELGDNERMPHALAASDARSRIRPQRVLRIRARRVPRRDEPDDHA
jgi:hypothetical protein